MSPGNFTVKMKAPTMMILITEECLEKMTRMTMTETLKTQNIETMTHYTITMLSADLQVHRLGLS